LSALFAIIRGSVQIVGSGEVMKVSFWRSLALVVLLGGLFFSVQQAPDVRALGLPPLYPVHFSSYAHEPCPSSIVVGTLSVNLGSNCSKYFSDAALDPPPQNDPKGYTVTIGPHWTQQCNDGSIKALPDYTYTTTIQGSTGYAYMTTFAPVCPGYGGVQLSIQLKLQPYGAGGQAYFFTLGDVH
jgi:hypothetical protein